MRDYEDRYGRSRRDRDDTADYVRREYEYRGGGGGGYRQDSDYGRGNERSYGRGQERARDRGANFAGGMMDDMRRYARGDYDRDDDRGRSGYGQGYGEDRSYGYERDRSMGERDYGGYGRDYERDYGTRDDYGSRGYGARDYGRDRGDWGLSDYSRSGRSERGWLERAGDEVASWFGDEDAERRRRMDEMRGHRGRGPRGYTRSDDRIREDVSDRLTDDPYVDASDIDITVSAGEVTLSGHVGHRSAKRRAEDVAESVSGVTHVQNNLRVRQSGDMGTGPGSATAAGATAMAGMTGGTTGTTTGTGGAADATIRTGGKMRT